MQTIAFGPTIRLLRQAKGISLREMARRLGVSPAFLSQIEAGRTHRIPKARIVQVAKMLGVSEAYLLGTAHRIHPKVVEFLRQTPEAAEFMITAMSEGLGPQDFTELRKSVKSRPGKGPLRRAKLPAKGKKLHREREKGENLSSYLDPALCLTGVSVQNKKRLFHRFVKLVAKRNKALGTELLLEGLENRERQAATAVGGGVALPHAFLPEVDEPIVGAVQLRRSIPFNSAGEERVRTVFFLLGSDKKPEQHISLLARIARLCSDAGFIDAFNKARTNRELYKTILRWDERVWEQ